MGLSLGDIAIGTEGLYLGDILIGADNAFVPPIIPETQFLIDILAVGGGGGGGFRGDNVDQFRGGGGGGGGVVTGSVYAQLNVPGWGMAINVGGGATAADTSGLPYDPTSNNGDDSYIAATGELSWTADGGGSGGSGNDPTTGTGGMNGRNGGSGGGAALLRSSTGTPIANGVAGTATQPGGGTPGYGQPGCGVSGVNGGSGGSSRLQANTNCPTQAPGYYWPLDYQSVPYGVGGSSATTDAQTAGFGFGGNCNNNGSDGIIILRYAGNTQRGDGGQEIINSGGYMYHVYTGVGAQYFENIR